VRILQVLHPARAEQDGREKRVGDGRRGEEMSGKGEGKGRERRPSAFQGYAPEVFARAAEAAARGRHGGPGRHTTLIKRRGK
jgi:hypothetical protein